MVQHLMKGHLYGLSAATHLLTSPQEKLSQGEHAVVPAVVFRIPAHVRQHREEAWEEGGEDPGQGLDAVSDGAHSEALLTDAGSFLGLFQEGGKHSSEVGGE